MRWADYPQVELIYADDCPNVDATRAALRQAFAECGQAPRWFEWNRDDRNAPTHARCYGSPTVLVNGRDVSGQSPSDTADCCRLYDDEAGDLRSAPSGHRIAAALREADEVTEMNEKGELLNARKIEVFSAGCPLCENTLRLVESVSGPFYEITVRDMRDPNVTERARRLGIERVPAVVIDGALADCCKGPKLNADTLRAAGLGRPLT